MPHVHLQVGEKVHVLSAGEGVEGTNAAHDGGVEEDLLPTRLKARALEGGDSVAHVEINQRRELVWGTVEHLVCSRGRKLPSRRIVLNLARNLRGEAGDKDVSKLVGTDHCVIVNGEEGGEVTGGGVVGKAVEGVVVFL